MEILTRLRRALRSLADRLDPPGLVTVTISSTPEQRAEVGRQVVEAMREYRRRGGRGFA